MTMMISIGPLTAPPVDRANTNGIHARNGIVPGHEPYAVAWVEIGLHPSYGASVASGPVCRLGCLGLVEGCRPAGQEVQGVVGWGAGLGGVGGDPQACVRGEVQCLERQR